jgi:hypothetical protein
MTSEELSVAGIPPTEEEIQGTENTQLQEGNPIPATAPESENREDSSAITEFIFGVVQVFVGYEDLQVQLWCRCFCTIVRVSHRARHHET